MKKITRTIMGLAMTSALAFNASATIVSGAVTEGSGQFVELIVPFSESNPDNTVGNNTFQDHNLYAFNEGQNIVINNDIHVDDAGNGVSGIISAGTEVASHYVFFDPRSSISQEGNVTFDSNVLAIITSTNNLAGSDFLLNNGVNYQNPGARGLEANTDSAWFVGNTVYVDWRASTPGDYIRVLTEHSVAAEVPAPNTLFAFGGVLLGLAALRRRRKA